MKSYHHLAGRLCEKMPVVWRRLAEHVKMQMCMDCNHYQSDANSVRAFSDCGTLVRGACNVHSHTTRSYAVPDERNKGQRSEVATGWLAT